MMDVFQQIEKAIETWLTQISVKEERLIKYENLQHRINQTITQIEYNEEKVINIARIQYVANCWISILKLIYTDEFKEDLIYNVLHLFEIGEISLLLCFSIIVLIMNN